MQYRSDNFAFISAIPLPQCQQNSHSVKSSVFCPSFQTSSTHSFSHCRVRITTAVRATIAAPHSNHPHETTQAPLNTASPLRRFVDLPPELRLRTALAILVGILNGLIAVSQPVFFSRTLDAVLSNAAIIGTPVSWTPIRVSLLQLACVYFGELVTDFAYVRLITSVFDLLVASLQTKVFQASIANDLSFFDVRGENVTRVLTADIPQLRNFLWNNISYDRGLRCAVQIIAGCILALVVDPMLSGGIFVLLIPILAVASGRIGLKKMTADNMYANADGDLRFIVTQAVSAIRTVKAYGGERIESESFKNELDTALAHSGQVARARANSDAMIRITIYVTLLAVYSWGGYSVGVGILSTKRFLALTTLCRLLTFSIIGSVYTWNDFVSIQGCLNRTYKLLDRATSSPTVLRTLPYRQMPTTRESAEIEFRNVSFSYPTRPTVPVIDNLSLTIERGTTTALVGESGAGKTTVASMVTRFYKPSSGQILLNGVDIHDLDPQEFCRSIALVNQSPEIFQGTVRFNIAYGCPDATDAQVKAAAVAANADSFISELPNGYDTYLAKGSALSGGQRQRISIARALLRDVPLLVLDEYTSALDSESEAAIQSALERLISGRTVLVIAHRLSTIRNAHRIVFIRDGAVAESGTYNELISRPGGAFRQMVASSTKVMMTN